MGWCCRYLVASMVLSAPLVSADGLTSDHWYVGAKAGWVSGSSSCEGHATSCSSDTAGGGIYVGYVVNDWLALEGGYDYLGDITADYPALDNPNVSAHYKGRMQGLEFVAKPYWEMTDALTVFAKAGTLAWNMDVTGQEVGYESTANDNGWSPLLGTGIEYAFNRNWSMSLEYQWVNNVGGSATGGTDLNMVNLAVSYHFAPESMATPPAPVPAPTPVQPAPASTIYKEQKWTISSAPFASNSSQLTVELQQALQPAIQRLREHPQATVLIRAHTDSSGSSEFNQRLSDQRAQAVQGYMMKQGIAPTQLRVMGYGETQPIADNMTKVGRYQNRRVELWAPEFEEMAESVSSLSARVESGAAIAPKAYVKSDNVGNQ